MFAIQTTATLGLPLASLGPTNSITRDEGDDAMKTTTFRAVLIASLAMLASVGVIADSAADEKTVAALDTEYQAAVKNNNAATMDRILADNFDVTLGTGKSYSKADLLNMARTADPI